MRFTELQEKQSLEGFNTRQALYHGTDVDITEFDPKFFRSRHLYTSPDVRTSAFYGKHVYLVHGKEGKRADLINDTAMLMDIAEDLCEDFHDDVSEQVYPLIELLMSENSHDEDYDESDAEKDPRYIAALHAHAKSECFEFIQSGKLYDRDMRGHFQAEVLDWCFERGYVSVKFHDYNSDGQPISIVWQEASDVKIIRQLSDDEVTNATHHEFHDLDESVGNETEVDFSAIVKDLKKDQFTGPLFKKDFPAESLDVKGIDATVRRLLFQNHEVRRFMTQRGIHYKGAMRHDIEPTLDSLVWVVKEFAKAASQQSRGTVSTYTKKELGTWISTTRGWRNLSENAQRELLSVPGIRPNKPVVLYRGLMFNTKYSDADKTAATLGPFLKAIRSGKRQLTLPQEKASSWSHSPAVAEKFARYRANHSNFDGMMSWLSREKDKRHIDGDLGVVLVTIARPEDILVDLAMIDLGNYAPSMEGEAEVILKPGAKLVRIWMAMNQAGQMDLSGSTEETETEALIKKVVSAANMIDVQTKFPGKLMYGSLPFDFDDVTAAMENRSALVKKAQTLYDTLKPVLEGVDVKSLDPSSVAPEAQRKLNALTTLVTNAQYFTKYDDSALEYLKRASSPTGRHNRDGDFLESNRQSIWKQLQKMEGREPHYRDKIPVYYRLKPVNQEALLGDLMDRYVAIGKPEPLPTNWAEKLAYVTKLLKHVRGYNGLAAWYSSMTKALIELES